MGELSCVARPAPDHRCKRVIGRRRRVVFDCRPAEVVCELASAGFGAEPPYGWIELALSGCKVVRRTLGMAGSVDM
jgi:hypothetical protein